MYDTDRLLGAFLSVSYGGYHVEIHQSQRVRQETQLQQETPSLTSYIETPSQLKEQLTVLQIRRSYQAQPFTLTEMLSFWATDAARNEDMTGANPWIFKKDELRFPLMTL